MGNQVKFALCELNHSDNSPIRNILKSYEANTFFFADGESGCFDPDQILLFDSYDAAETVRRLAWDYNYVALGIVIWESEYPEEIDYTYVAWGKEKNLEVKYNREN